MHHTASTGQHSTYSPLASRYCPAGSRTTGTPRRPARGSSKRWPGRRGMDRPPALDNLWLDAYFAAYSQQMRRMPYETLCAGHPDPLRVVTFASEESIQDLIPGV